MLKILFPTIANHTKAYDFTMLTLRVLCGFMFCFIHQKVLPVQGLWGPRPDFVETITKLNFPNPYFFAWLAVWSEFLGGILLIAGLLTRPAAFFNAINMIVAAFMVHKGALGQKAGFPFVYLILFILLMLNGGGRYSIDALLSKRIIQPKE
jgi:putative oxidoreductase